MLCVSDNWWERGWGVLRNAQVAAAWARCFYDQLQTHSDFGYVLPNYVLSSPGMIKMGLTAIKKSPFSGD